MTATESAFLTELVQSGTTTVQQAEAAAARTTNVQVRQFAQVLIDNHRQLNTTLAQIAQANNVTLPANIATTANTATGTTTGNTSTGATTNTGTTTGATTNTGTTTSATTDTGTTTGATTNTGTTTGTTGTTPATTGATPLANPSVATNEESDRIFLQQSLQQQRQYVSRFLAQATGATNTQLKAFASNALPLLNLQLVTAKELGASLDPLAYLQGAYEDGLGEIALANIALQKTQDADVRAFANLMIDHHTAMNAQIATIAQGKGLTLAADTPLPIEHVVARDSVTQINGADFNKAYMSHNVVVHLGDVGATQAQSTAGTDPEVRTFATASLPMLQQHLNEANEIYERLKPSTLVAAFQNNVSEILVSSLATTQRATNEAVRTFAQRMITDHATQNTSVAQLAAQENVILPNVLPAEGVIAYRTLLPKTGDDFNRSFMAENISLHEAAVALFTERSTIETDPEQLAFARAALPVLNTHLQAATQLNSSLPAATTPTGTTTPPATVTPPATTTPPGTTTPPATTTPTDTTTPPATTTPTDTTTPPATTTPTDTTTPPAATTPADTTTPPAATTPPATTTPTDTTTPPAATTPADTTTPPAATTPADTTTPPATTTPTDTTTPPAATTPADTTTPA